MNYPMARACKYSALDCVADAGPKAADYSLFNKDYVGPFKREAVLRANTEFAVLGGCQKNLEAAQPGKTAFV
jgi:hypothetical protein